MITYPEDRFHDYFRNCKPLSMKRNLSLFFSLLALFSLIHCDGPQETPDSQNVLPLSGPYLGQQPPGESPELFAPGIVSTGLYERDLVMTPDGKEIYFCVAAPGFLQATIMVTRLTDKGWTHPEVMEQMDQPGILNFEPCISADGSRFFFLSTRPDTLAGETGRGDQDIWVMERQGEGWSEPRNLGAPVNTDQAEFYPSLTREGTLYFTRAEKDSRIHYIYRSEFRDGAYQEPERLPVQVNMGTNRYNAFISPDESWIIVPAVGREDSFGGTDYYISFRDSSGNWSEPVHFGPEINSRWDGDYSTSLSPDGEYLFFMSNRIADDLLDPGKLSYEFFRDLGNHTGNGNADIYWVSSTVINALNPYKKSNHED